MNDPDNERSTRILHLAQCIFKAGVALENSNWPDCEKECREAARLCRVVQLIDKQEAEGAD